PLRNHWRRRGRPHERCRITLVSGIFRRLAATLLHLPVWSNGDDKRGQEKLGVCARAVRRSAFKLRGGREFADRRRDIYRADQLQRIRNGVWRRRGFWIDEAYRVTRRTGRSHPHAVQRD